MSHSSVHSLSFKVEKICTVQLSVAYVALLAGSGNDAGCNNGGKNGGLILRYAKTIISVDFFIPG